MLTPFEHCQNAKFTVFVYESSTDVQPIWLSVDPQYQSIIIATNEITSVLIYNLSLSARLFTFAQDNFNRITTPSYNISIRFENNNWVLLTNSYPVYLVYNQITQMQVQFSDDEDDNVIIKLAESSQLSSFVKYSNSTSATILVQSNSAETSSTTMNISYTDSYHKDNQYWQHFEVHLNLFASEPPVFVHNFNAFVVSRCQDAVYILPNYSDPDSFNITVRLDSGTPDWIAINNFTISINSKSGQNVTDGLTQIDLILADETNSWTKYILNVIVEPIVSPVFGHISDMSRQQLANGVFINISSANQIDVVDCSSHQTINWIDFSNSTLKLSSNATLYNQTWFKLVSTDSCNNKVYSNSFYIIIIRSSPVLINEFGPLIVPRGIYTLFEIPDDLFIDFDNNPLTYNASIISWSQKNFIDVGVKLSLENKLYLYVFSNFTMDWNVSVSASNQYSTSEFAVDIKIIRWASTNCIKCNGPNQSQCTECTSNYNLDSSGMWLIKNSYFLFDQFTFFQVCSIIAFASSVVHICLSFVFGRNLLNSIINLQLIIVFVLCSGQGEAQLKELLSNILFIKFDFGFIHQITFDNKYIWWNAESSRMAELQFYCQSTVQNYFFVLMFLLSAFIVLYIIKHFSKWQNFIEIHLQDISNTIWIFRKNQQNTNLPKHAAEWMFINIMWMFVTISIINDTIALTDNVVTSLLSLTIVFVFAVYLYKTRFKIFRLKFITEMEVEYRYVHETNLFKM